MTQVMFHVLLFLSAFACFYSNDIVLTVSPSMDDGPIVWKQTVTISCNWTPGNRMYGDMVVGETSESLYSDGQYGEIVSLEDPEQRIYFVSDDDIGEGTLVIKDVTKADARQFGCMVSRKGNSNNINLDIIEPPMAGVVNFVAVPEFTTVDLTWDAVEGASSYNVGWQVVGTADWTTVDVTTNSHQFTDLPDASNFVAKVDASNAAGIREGIEPAEISFTTIRHCDAGKVKCADQEQCIWESYVCDGYKDCDDVSDEENCTAVQYKITYSIFNHHWARSRDPQFVYIRGSNGETAYHRCYADFNVINQDVLCVFESDIDIGDYECVFLKSGGRDGLDLKKVSVQIDGIETHTIVPQGRANSIGLDNGETKKFCKSGHIAY